MKALEARLANKSYVEKAPAALVEETQKKLIEKRALATRLEAELEILR